MRRVIPPFSSFAIPALMLLTFSGNQCDEGGQRPPPLPERLSALPPPVNFADPPAGRTFLPAGDSHRGAAGAHMDSTSYVRTSVGGDAVQPSASPTALEASGAILAGSNAAPAAAGYGGVATIPEVHGVPVQDVRTGPKALLNRLAGRATPSVARELAAAQQDLPQGLPTDPASRTLRSLVPSETDSPRSRAIFHLKNAATLMQVRQFGDAIEQIEKAITIDPDNAEAYSLKAEALNKAKRFGEAEAAALRALELEPRNSRALQNLAWSRFKLGKYAGAFASASKAIVEKPRDALNYVIRSRSEFKLGQREDALNDLRMAATLDPRFKREYDLASTGAEPVDTLDDASSLLDQLLQAFWSVPRGKRWVLLLGFCSILAGCVVLFRQRRRREDWRRALGIVPEQERNLSLATARSQAAQEVPVSPSTGGRLAGKYEIVRMIGRGGMGEVYFATDHSLGRPVAIKKLSKGFLESTPQAKEMFLKEAKTVAAVHHPSIVDIYEVFADGDAVYMVFEHVRGKTLQQILLEKKRLSAEDAAAILKPVCQALEFAHRKGLVHRDLKPSNIMVMEEGLVKLLDFGIARSFREDVAPMSAITNAVETRQFARTGTVVGTPQYMAPETEQGLVCREGDIYSLGVCLYEMVCGVPPFDYDVTLTQKVEMGYAPPSRKVPGLPEALDELVAKSLQPTPQLRLKTPREFMQRLEASAGPQFPLGRPSHSRSSL